MDVPGGDARLAKVKARLCPWLDEPYFEVTPRYLAMAQNRCTHENHGVRLDETDRTATCKGCGKQVDPFDALLHYAASERRLVETRKAIKAAAEAEVARKHREKDRRPFARAVVRRTARKDLSLKAEPVIGYTLTLECGHTREVGECNRFRRVTCGQCEEVARRTAVAGANQTTI